MAERKGTFIEDQTQIVDEDYQSNQSMYLTSTPKNKSDRYEQNRSMQQQQSSLLQQLQQQQQLQGSSIREIPPKPPKQKKSISTKTFAHGLMDVSLLTTHATQLRTVISNKEHEFYDVLIWMIGVSIALQIVSGILLLTSDFFKTQDKVTDRHNQKKRKVLSFISLCIVAVNTPLKILISAFYVAQEPSGQMKTVPMFAPGSYSFHNHTEL